MLELAPNGEIFDYIAETGAFSEPVCRFFMSRILSALKHCHDKGFSHRDLKPENIFFGKNHIIKLADFGFTTVMNGDEKLRTSLGTPGYMAPEIMLQKHYDGKSVDLFAAAVINFIMKSEIPPFIQAESTD